MYHFEDLLNQPLAVAFIDEIKGKKRWRIRVGMIVGTPDGHAFLLPPQTRPAFHLQPEWQERIKPVPASLLDSFGADFAIFVKLGALPEDADLDDYSPTGINLNS